MQAEFQAIRGEPFSLKLALGGDEGPESTAQQHNRWLRVYFLADGKHSQPVEVASFSFATHGNGAQGQQAPVCAGDEVQCAMTLHEPGILIVLAYNSLHGFWEREMRVYLLEQR